MNQRRLTPREQVEQQLTAAKARLTAAKRKISQVQKDTEPQIKKTKRVHTKQVSEMSSFSASSSASSSSGTPPLWDLADFPTLQRDASDTISRYFVDNQFSEIENQKLWAEMQRTHSSSPDYSKCNDDMTARVKWMQIVREWESGDRITFCRDTVDESTTKAIMIIFAGDPVRLPGVNSYSSARTATNILHQHVDKLRVKVALPICWMQVEFEMKTMEPWVRQFMKPNPDGNIAVDTYDLNAQVYGLMVATLEKHGRTLTKEYATNTTNAIERQVRDLPNHQKNQLNASYITQIFPNNAAKPKVEEMLRGGSQKKLDNMNNSEPVDGTWITMDLTNGFQPVIQNNPEATIFIRPGPPGHSRVGSTIAMGLPEYEAAVALMLSEQEGQQFVVKVQTPNIPNQAVQIYDQTRTLLCFARPDISGAEEYRALVNAVVATDHGRKGYYSAMVLVEKKQMNMTTSNKGGRKGGGRKVLKIRIDKELSMQNEYW